MNVASCAAIFQGVFGHFTYGLSMIKAIAVILLRALAALLNRSSSPVATKARYFEHMQSMKHLVKLDRT